MNYIKNGVKEKVGGMGGMSGRVKKSLRKFFLYF
jgi:hypothetical protein